jgi:hypothetical protein
LVNQVDALSLLDRRMEADGLRLSEDLFKKLHYEVTKRLGTKDGPFYPPRRRLARWRSRRVRPDLSDAYAHRLPAA